MKNNQAFTLIELLVVVLIIGILAAVALPQYQKAVAKSRFVQLQISFDALIKAHDLYFLEHGSYTNQLEDLTFTPSNVPEILCTVNEDVDSCVLYDKDHSFAFAALEKFRSNGKKLCCAYESSNWVLEEYCRQLMGATEKKSNSNLRCYWEE